MPHREEDWSDSDDENLSEIETSVLLGVPDGVIDTDSDLIDAAVSRIGGHPAFLPSREPLFTSSQCKVCSDPSKLLVQLWCPFEDSPMDRALYVWGCSRSSCQGKGGSVRAWRGLRRNGRYAAKLEKKLAQRREAEAAKARETASKLEAANAAKTNPFAMKATSPSGSFGFGNSLFGPSAEPAAALPPETAHAEPISDSTGRPESDHDEESDLSYSDGEEELLTAMASVTMEESVWKAAPAYKPFYLSTVSEYLPPESKPKIPLDAQEPDIDEDSSKAKGGKAWASETYENSLDMDHVFERFTKRVACEGEQCVRYELDGTPLPYSSDSVFLSLFPSSPSSAPALTNVTKAAFQPPAPKRAYFPGSDAIAKCPICRSKRVFECQLMPNLINVLQKEDRDSDSKKGAQTDEERRKTLEKALREGGSDSGMDWGTCLIFSCEKDCCLDDVRKEDTECWREELVLIQSAL